MKRQKLNLRFIWILFSYRSCLTLIRINPKPVIEFHKAAFLGSRDHLDTDFLSRVLDSMFFTMFVTDRGPPWRTWDAWDELYTAMPELLKTEAQDRQLVLVHIKELAQKLYVNEMPNQQVYQQKVLMPPEGAFSRIHQPEFPTINSQQVQAIINEGITKNDLQSRLQSYKNNPKIIPIGPHLPSFNDGRPTVTHTARKMEVLKTCVSCIFENKIADARKIFPAVLRILKQRDEARLFLCRELSKIVQGSNKATLDHPQFDLVIKLMNRALQDDSPKYLHDIAASLLPLSGSFCRKLCPGVIQFAYSCIQGHGIWKTQMFWEQAFYQEIQANIKNLYVNKPLERNSNYLNDSVHGALNSYDFRAAQEQSALEIAADQMMKWPTVDQERQNYFSNSEEQILYSQAAHYANRMISLLIPMDVRSNTKVKKIERHVEEDASISNSVLESRSDQSTDGFEERNASEVEQAVVRQVEKFIDKVCNEGGVTPDHIRKLHELIPSLVEMHCETLDIVYRESKRIPPVQKPKIQVPMLLSGEEIACEPIRTVLLADGREETLSPLLPAEGALFLTNYRVIFKGLPCDSLTCEQSVIRAFPIASLTKEKRITGIHSNEQVLPDGLQLRSCTFQLIKVAFDEEVNQETIELFRKSLNRIRHPDDEFGHFAFANHIMALKPQHQKAKEKNATLKGFAKKTLLRTARKAGFKQKSTTKRKYNFSASSDVDAFYASSTSGHNNMLNNNNNHENSDDDDDGSDENIDSLPLKGVTVKDVERLKERSFVKDWQRLGLTSNGFRISSINCNYILCRTYPAIIVCPRSVSDDQLKSLAKTYKNQRIPVPTWRHQNGAILLRGAVSLAKGVMGMLKSGSGNNSTEGRVDVLQDVHDRYFCAIIPHHHQPHHVTHSDSIDSLAAPKLHLTPMSGRKGERNHQKPNKWESLKRNAGGLRDINQYDDNYMPHSRVRVPFYFLGERSQSKSVKLSELGAEYIPVYYNDNRHSREAFKKLMRACLPSGINNEPDHTFTKLIEQSEWLQQIRSLLQLSGTVVDLLDLHEASVNLAFEDGWDITSQVSSLAQLCLDPYYRTIEGFRVLIEKEWLAFGHRFGHRSNLKPNSSSFAPIFLQFLDAVHQIQLQFPLSFEFNEFYLKFLAYHSVSCRFRTFLFDCELERVDLGITAVEDKRGSLNSHKHMVETGTGSDDDSIYPGGLRSSITNQPKLGISIFDYIERHHVRTPVFYNFQYTTDPHQQVLRPQSSVSMLEVWDYYIYEELAQGPAYDLELTGSDNIDEDSEYSAKQPKRKFVTMGYDNISKCDPDSFTQMLDELKQTESERGILPQKWKQVWDKLELPHSDSLTRHASFSSALVRSHGRYMHNM